MQVRPQDIDDYSMVDLLEAFVSHSAIHALEDRDAWERARMIALYAAAPHTKKKLKATDIVTFSWEKDTGLKGTKSNKWTKAEIEELKKQGHPIFK